MSQHDFVIDNQSFPATRTDLNAAILAVASNSSGATAPTTTYANQFWYDTSTNILYIRNEANDGWVSVITLDASMTATASELNQLDAITRGSILYGNASGDTARLAKGGAGTVLTSDGTDISWAAAAGGGGAMEFINTTDISNAATYNFTTFDSSKYDAYVLYVYNILPATDNTYLYCRTSTDGGSSYDSTGGDYVWSLNTKGSGVNGILNDYGRVTQTLGNETDEPGASCTITIFSPHLAKPTMISAVGVMNMAQDPGIFAVAADFQSITVRQANSDVDGFRLLFSTGNILSGTVSVYGVVNS